MELNFSESWAKLLEKMSGWFDQLIIMLPNVLLALIALTVFIVVSRYVRRGSIRVMDRFVDNYAINRLLGRMFGLITLAIGGFIMLNILQLDKAVTSLLAGAGIIGLAIGFAFQDMIANLISGVMIAIRKPFKRGDLIETNDYFGTVIGMDMRNTILRLPQGQDVIIPNKDVFQNSIKNFATGCRRIDLEVGVAYDSDLHTVEEVAKEAISAIPYLGKGKDIDVHYFSFGGSSIDLKVLYWIDQSKQPDFLQAQSEGIKRIKAAFDQNDISIPFPIRTLDFSMNKLQAVHKGLEPATNTISNN